MFNQKQLLCRSRQINQKIVLFSHVMKRTHSISSKFHRNKTKLTDSRPWLVFPLFQQSLTLVWLKKKSLIQKYLERSEREGGHHRSSGGKNILTPNAVNYSHWRIPKKCSCVTFSLSEMSYSVCLHAGIWSAYKTRKSKASYQAPSTVLKVPVHSTQWS